MEIYVETYDIEGVGCVCIWDAVGQIEFHITHGMFLGVKIPWNKKVKELQHQAEDIGKTFLSSNKSH